MVSPQYSHSLEGRAIYPTSRFMPYILLLIVSKFFRTFAIFLSYDVLKVIHLIHLLCMIKGLAATILIPLQKPFTSGPQLSKRIWVAIIQQALLNTIVNLLWLFALTLCGPLRTILLYEHSEIVIAGAAASVFIGSTSGPAKLRGAVFIIVAIISLLLFDNDDVIASVQNQGPEFGHAGIEDNHGPHRSIITHLFYHITSWFGLSDHKGGVCLLVLTLGIHVLSKNAAKKVSPLVGGMKRLQALSNLVSFIMLLPWAVVTYFGTSDLGGSITSMIFPILVITVFIFIVDFYVESVSIQKMDCALVARYGSMSIFIIALILSCFWSEAYKAKVTIHDHIQEIIAEEHMLSGGVIFSIVLLLFATHILTSPTKGVRGSFIGYSPSGLPLYNITGDALQRTSQSAALIAKNGLKKILEESDSRRIFYFLCINLVFTFVELVYGVWTNSLGLISDGFHMFFDCSALVLGLYAAVMSRWKATRIFSFGYDRVEVLSGFINGLFLTVIAAFVFTAAIGRLFDPPEISTERLLTVSVAGLIVNLIGMTAFAHAHTHGGQACRGHATPAAAPTPQTSTCSTTNSHHGHSHTPVKDSHGHGQSSHSHGNMRGSTNMRGVFLHVMADTLGSVGVIVSTILIENFGWNIADPICSLFIAIMIFMSIVPLLQETAMILLLRTPSDLVQKELDFGLQKVLALEGVTSYGEQHFWQHSSDKFFGTLHVQIRPEAAEQKIISQVNSVFKEFGISHMTVQVEKNSFYEHMSGLTTDLQMMSNITKNYRTPISFRNSAEYVKSV